MTVTITFDTLVEAQHWVSAEPFDNAALISKETGRVFYLSEMGDFEEELPDDLDDASRYWSVPDKRDLDLGQRLVFRFVDEHLPDEYGTVRSYFQRRGAYARFKDLLERHEQLDRWYEYEHAATERALREWARDQGLTVEPASTEIEA